MRRLALVFVCVVAACRGPKPIPLPAGWTLPDSAQDYDVLYATDRELLTVAQYEKRVAKGNPDPFGPGRSRATTYGAGRVVLEPDARKGGLRPRLARLDRWTGGSTTFFRELGRRAADREVVVFVHGFNNSLREATFRAALLTHYLGPGDVPVAYSWPAKQGAGFSLFRDVLGYLADRDAADWTVRHCRAFLQRLARTERIRRFHLVAHSTGAAVVTRALREIRIRNGDLEGKLARVVLAAPDVDLDVFLDRFLGERAHHLAEKVTVFLSRKDPALNVATKIRADYPRVGNAPLHDLRQTPTPRIVKLVKEIELVDVTEIGKEGRTHAYFVESPVVAAQLVRLFRGQPLDAEKRSERGLTWLELRPSEPPSSARRPDRQRPAPRYP